MKKLILITIVLLLSAQVPAHAIQVGNEIPDFRVQKLDGNDFVISEIKGRSPILIVFWTTWCPNCKKEMPAIKRAFQKLKPGQLEIIAINAGVNDPIERVKKYVQKYSISYPVGYDVGSKITAQFKVQGVPKVILTDKKGIVRYASHALPENLSERIQQFNH